MSSIDPIIITFPDLTVTADSFPVHRLPSDILAEVFIFCLPGLSELATSSHSAPLLLCGVCSSWRALAISTPRLWQTFDFSVHLHVKPKLDPVSLVGGIRTWLERSRTLPLTIHFCFYTNADIPQKYWPAFETLLHYASRWDHFELSAERRTPWPQFGDLPILRTIDVYNSDIDGIPFTSAPCLKKFSLVSLPPDPMSISAVPWNQLTKLRIRDPQTLSTVLELFRYCSQLESVALMIDEPDAGASLLSNRCRVEHMGLQRIVFRFTTDCRAEVLESLTLPGLTELSLFNDTFDRGRPCCSQLLDLFTRSNCKLQKLSLGLPKFRPIQLLECLEHQSCQTLTYLEVEGVEGSPMFNNKLLVRLTRSEEGGRITPCPKLAHLKLTTCYRSEISFPDSLGKMIRSRCFGPTQDEQLQSLHIITYHPLSKEDYDLLHFTMYSGGLRFNYTCFAEGSSGSESDSYTSEHEG